MLELMDSQQPLVEAQHAARTRMQVGNPCLAFDQIAEGSAQMCLSSVDFRNPVNASERTALDLCSQASLAMRCRAQVARGLFA